MYGGGSEAMEKPLPDPVPSAASKEVAEQFRSFVDPDDVAPHVSSPTPLPSIPDPILP